MRGANIHRLTEGLERLGRARTASETGEVLRACVAAYGYDNVALTRSQFGETLDLPWNWMPSDFGEAYVTLGWERYDPELVYARSTLFPFTWADIPQRVRLTSGQQQMFSIANAFGLHDGLCVPLRGPDGRLDMVSLNSSHAGRATDPQQIGGVALLTLCALARFLDLDELEAAGASHELSNGTASERLAVAMPDDLASDRLAPPFTLAAGHLRALALIDAGARRWKMGLTQLASNLYLLRKMQPYSDLERWGFIVDEADDLRWRYYLAPSVLGMSYLRRTPGSAALRRDIWERELGRREVSDGLEAE